MARDLKDLASVAGQLGQVATPLADDAVAVWRGAATAMQIGWVRYDALPSGGGTDDQIATEVPFTPAGSIASTNVQAAIEELDAEKAAAAHTHALDGATITGNLPVSKLNGGTNASVSTVWHGDGSWKAVTGEAATAAANVSVAGLADNIAPATADVEAWLQAIDAALATAGIANVVEDTTPQLGGDLDGLQRRITNAVLDQSSTVAPPYTLQASDLGKSIRVNPTADGTITLPNPATAPFSTIPDGRFCSITSLSASFNVAVSAAVSGTLRSQNNLSTWSSGTDTVYLGYRTAGGAFARLELYKEGGSWRLHGPLRAAATEDVSPTSGGAEPTTVAAAATSHLLTLAQRAHHNVLLLAGSATALRVPTSAPAGSVWHFEVTAAVSVTVEVQSDVGSVNGTAGAAELFVAEAGATGTIWVRSNPGAAPVVRAIGDTVNERALTVNLEEGRMHDYGGGDVTASVTLTAADFARRVLYMTIVPPAATAVNITLPPIANITNKPRTLAFFYPRVASDGTRDVTITAPAGELRSNPQTTGWVPTTNPIAIGNTGALQDDAVGTLYALPPNSTNATGLYYYVGPARTP